MCQLYSHHHVQMLYPQQTIPVAAAAAASSSKKDQTDRTTHLTVLPRPPADVDALIGTRKNHFFTEKVIDAFVSDAQQTLISVRTRGRFLFVIFDLFRHFLLLRLLPQGRQCFISTMLTNMIWRSHTHGRNWPLTRWSSKTGSSPHTRRRLPPNQQCSVYLW